jgi:arylsulfatase A-like enzyme
LAGVEFIDENDGGPGVRLRKRERTKTMVAEDNRRPELASSPHRARKPVRCAASDRRPFLPSRPTYIRWIVATLAAAVLLCAIQLAYAVSANLPQPDHVVVVVFENHSFDEIVDPNRAPFIYRLATGGALFADAFAVTHPSQPNYFALFSGSTQGVRDNGDYTFDAPNLADALEAARKSFIGYVETGSPRKHNPWESFTSARTTERNFSQFPSDFTQLPTVSFVIPGLDNDMHDGSVSDGDTWLKVHLGAYAEWAKTHNSLLIVTFDEDDNGAKNHIPTIIYGARVRPGRYTERISHYNVLSTLLAMYGLPTFAKAATAPPIRTIWDQ